MKSIFYTIDAIFLCLMLFAACILMVLAGKILRNRFFHKDEQESRGGITSLLGALFGLWGFILAFTFGSSGSRFENIRSTMVEEANAIRNVLLRAEALPDSVRSGFREDLRQYLEARIDYYNYGDDLHKFEKTKQDAVDIGKRLWKRAIEASAQPNLGSAANNIMATLTNMFDIGTRRDAMLLSGIPELISVMLFFLALVISFVGGFTSPVLNKKEWVVITAFILLACVIIYIILDLARPMKGLIKPDVGQDKIVQLRKLF
jgi:ABC-type multidrug transport system fused ATPase/permease subunit